MFLSTSSRGTLRVSGKHNSLFSEGPVLIGARMECIKEFANIYKERRRQMKEAKHNPKTNWPRPSKRTR